jgi:nitrogen fixation protein NifZ
MGLAREQEIEIRAAPCFSPGEKVRATKHVKNDGTYPRR